MTRRQRAAARLWFGSGALARRLAGRAADWIRKGPTRTHRVVRIVLVILGLYVAARIVRAAPNLMWALTALWCWCAARASRPTEEAEPEHLSGEPESDPRESVLRLLYDALGDRPAMYLSEVLQYLQERGHGKGWKVADLRARLEALGIPVELKLKTGGKGPTRGVVKAQLPPLSQPDPQEASPAPSTAA